MPKVKVLVGCNYPPDDTRAEPGDVIDVDDKVAKALIRMDAAEPYKAPSGSKAKQSDSRTSQEPSGDDTGGEG